MSLPLWCYTDSYRLDHPNQYSDDITETVAYGEFRKSWPDIDDERIIFYGIRYLIDNYLSKPLTQEDLDELEWFASDHNAGGTPYPYPKDLFENIVKENGGYFPVKIDALPEGTVIYPHTPVYRIIASGKYARLVTYLETLLTSVYDPTNVATLSRHCKTIIQAAFDRSVDPDASWKLESRLHDFGARGVGCPEQQIVSGCAHLLNFSGSDTIAASYYIKKYLNNGRHIGESIPATEHSVMTSYPLEIEAVLNMLQKNGKGVFATVGDSYSWDNFLHYVVPACSNIHKHNGGFWVVRPDSGDPIECVIQGLKALDNTFGAIVNNKGYRVINNAGIIQGDGIDIHILKQIIHNVLAAGYSAENVAFGMGGGLLRKHNRDTMSFATKLCQITDSKGTRVVWKHPKTDASKDSLPGYTQVNYKGNIPMVYPQVATWEDRRYEHDLLQPVWDYGPVKGAFDTFDTIRTRAAVYWDDMPPHGNAISQQMQDKINKLKAEIE